MKYAVKDALDSLFRLFRFIVWYGVALAAVFYLLPILAIFLEGRFDALSSSVKFFSVIGLFAIVAAWQIGDRWDRIRSSARNRHSAGAVTIIQPEHHAPIFRLKGRG